MFTPTAPWWQFVARAVIVYTALLILVRLSGKRTLGEFRPFDLVVVVLVAEASGGALTGGDESVTGALLVVSTLVAVNYGVSFASARNEDFDALVEGRPVVLVRSGRRDDRALRSNNIPVSDLEESIRKAGLTREEEVRLALLETDGEITILPRRLQPRDG